MGIGGIFTKAFAGGFFGKLTAALFIAICVLLGVGPDTWAKFIVSDLPDWVTPGRAQAVFLTVAALTFIALTWPLLTRWRAHMATGLKNQASRPDANAVFKRQNPVLRRELGELLASGNRLCAALSDPGVPSPHPEANEWIVRVAQLVKQNFGEAAAIQIRNAQGLTTARPQNVETKRGHVWHAVYVVVVRLEELISSIDEDGERK